MPTRDELYEYLREKSARDRRVAEAGQMRDAGSFVSALSNAAASAGSLGGKSNPTDTVSNVSEDLYKTEMDQINAGDQATDQRLKLQSILAKKMEEKKPAKWKSVADAQVPEGKVLQEDEFGNQKLVDLPTGVKGFGKKEKPEKGSVNPRGEPLSEGEKTVDKTFAKEYADYVAGGGSAETARSVAQLDSLKGQLGKTNKASGPIVGLGNAMLGEEAMAVFNPEGTQIKQDIENNIQKNMKLILGGQFTEKEGQGILRRTFNPALPEAVNQARLNVLVETIKKAAEAKNQAIQYYEQNGTLQGFKGKIYSAADFYNIPFDSVGSAPQSAQQPVNPSPSAGGKKQIAKKQFSPSRNQTKITYSDGSVEVVDGRQ